MTTFPITPKAADPVLVASANAALRQRVLEGLPADHRIQQANGGAEALVHLESGAWKLLFLDRRLPDLDAEELSQTVRNRYPAVQVILLDEDGDANLAEWEAPLAPEAARELLGDSCREGCEARQESAAIVDGERRDDRIRQNSMAMPAAQLLPGMVGNSPSMRAVYRLVKLVAPRDTTVLITGPTGSGKELIARALHELSPRAMRSFSVVNCAAIPESLLEAELFGYSRGAFTGAIQSYAGRIQTAHLGTLFLDEIGDMPLSLQPKLLRFLEQKELQRLGSSQVVRVDTRVIAATNADLLKLVEEGKFREDLYYRLSSFPLVIPPLAGRMEDIASLAAYFLERFSTGQATPILSGDAVVRLQSESWPGNVRQLQNVIERALILAEGAAVIRSEHVMPGNAQPLGFATRLEGRGAGIRAF